WGNLPRSARASRSGCSFEPSDFRRTIERARRSADGSLTDTRTLALNAVAAIGTPFRYRGPMLNVGSAMPARLADVEVEDAQRQRVRLGSFWQGQRCILIFVRHFGCVGCAEQITELSPRLHELERAGVRVIVIGSGDPKYIAGFVARHGLADKH